MARKQLCVCIIVQVHMHVTYTLLTTQTHTQLLAAAINTQSLLDLLVAFRRGLILLEHHGNVGDGVRSSRLEIHILRGR